MRDYLLRLLGIDEVARESGQEQLYQLVGDLGARVENLSDDVKSVLVKLERSLVENQQILRKVDKLEDKLDPLPAVVDKHEDKIEELDAFRKNIMGAVAFAGIAFSALGAGVWAILTNFGGVIAFIRKIFGGL